MPAPLSKEQLRAIHAKLETRPDFQRKNIAKFLTEEQQQEYGLENQSMRANEGSLPQFEEARRQRFISNAKRIVGKRDAISQARKDQEERENDLRKKVAEQDELRIRKESELRHLYSDKKISYQEYQEKLATLYPNIKTRKNAIPDAESKVQKAEIESRLKEASEKYLNSKTDLENKLKQNTITENEYKKELESIEQSHEKSLTAIKDLAKGDEELADIIKKQKSAESYFENTRNPISIMPGGTQQGNRIYNKKTGTTYVSHALSPEEQRKLGVENPVIEAIGEDGEVIKIPAPQRPEDRERLQKLTTASVEAERLEKQKKIDIPSNSDSPADILLDALGG